MLKMMFSGNSFLHFLSLSLCADHTEEWTSSPRQSLGHLATSPGSVGCILEHHEVPLPNMKNPLQGKMVPLVKHELGQNERHS